MASEASHVSVLESFLRSHPSIRYIRYQWVDYAGILRVRIATVSYCRQLAMRSAPLAMSPIALTSTTVNEFMPGLVPTGIDHLYPDCSSLRPCLYAPSHAALMCFVSEGIDNAGFVRCPRTLLHQAISMAREDELDIKVGFEVEFRCFNPDGTDIDECLRGFSTAAGLKNRCISIIEEIMQLLEQSGIEVQQFHTEGTKGMFEISTGPMPAVQAVDAWVYTRETIKMLFWRNNIIATLHPSPAPEHHGIAAQFHLSISPPKEATAQPFLAGILHRLPALCALSLPLEESYKRVSDFASESGAYVAWGTENRDVPIRKIGTGHWEIRCCDGAANLYLVLAAFITSGLEGLKTGMELKWKDYLGCPSSIEEQERVNFGIQTRLPKNLAESLNELEKADWKESGLTEAAATYAKIKRHELISLRKLSHDDRRALLLRHF